MPGWVRNAKIKHDIAINNANRYKERTCSLTFAIPIHRLPHPTLPQILFKPFIPISFAKPPSQ
jgi:hypothetical protein